MTPALALFITLQNAVEVCSRHEVTHVSPIIYERGFKQCGYLVPEATKRINAFFAPPTKARQTVIDKAAIEKAVAALAANR